MEKETKGFVKGLEEFLTAAKEAEESGQWAKRTGKFGNFDAKARYGYRVKTGVFPSKENPEIDIQDKGDKLAVSTKLPIKKDPNLKVVGNTLEMKAKTPRGVIKRSVSIEKAKKIKRLKKPSSKKGILTIILSSKQRKKLANRLKIWRR